MRNETGQQREKIYSSIYREELSKIQPQATGITRGQIAAAKGRATRRFFALGF